MIKFVYFLFLSALAIYVQASAGCGKSLPDGVKAGKTTFQQMLVKDPATGEEFKRNFTINIPHSYNSSIEHPVILWFHGWGGATNDVGYFSKLGQKEGIITVNPIGMADYYNGTSEFGGWESWNVGDANQTVTCTQ